MKKKKKKKYQAGGAEATPFSVDDQIIDYTDFLSPDSMDMLDYYKTGGIDSYQSGGGELNGNAVVGHVGFKGDWHDNNLNPTESNGIFLGPKGPNPRKVQNGETRAYAPTDELNEITGIADAMQFAQAGGIEEMIMQMGGPEAMAMAGPPQQGMPQQQGMPVQNAPQQPVGQPQDKSAVILGDKVEPESGKEYQKLAEELKKIAKNDPNNTRVQDEIKEKMAQLALKQEAQRVMEEQFPYGPPPDPSAQQVDSLNQSMAMMQMLQGQGDGAPPVGQQIPLEAPIEPQEVPLAQEGMIEMLQNGNIEEDRIIKELQAEYLLSQQRGDTIDPKRKKEAELALQRMYQELREDERQAYQRETLVGNEFYDDKQKAAAQIDNVVGGLGTPFNPNFLDDDYVNVKQRPGAAEYAASEMQTIPSESVGSVSTQALADPTLSPIVAPDSGFQFRDKNREALAMMEIGKTVGFGDPAFEEKDPKKEGKGKTDWAGIATLAGAGIASNIGNIMYLAEQGKDYDYNDPGKYMVDPRLVSLDEQRKDIETRMNRVSYENRMRGQGDITREAFLAGQELQQMAPTYEKEQNLNAQIINSADQFNAQMRMSADDINAQNKAAAQKQYYDAISQIGQNINNLAIDINQRSQNKEMYSLLDGYFDNYSYRRGEGWVFTGNKETKKTT